MPTPRAATERDQTELRTIADRLRDESRAVQNEFAKLNSERDEAFERHAAEVRTALDEMQADLDAARDRLAREQAATREQAREDLDEVLATLHGRYDELRLQLRLAEMDASDRVESLRREAGLILDRGRAAVRSARHALGHLLP
jgi:SMC interacting uncharacterized protein involved in chromosome segregation